MPTLLLNSYSFPLIGNGALSGLRKTAMLSYWGNEQWQEKWIETKRCPISEYPLKDGWTKLFIINQGRSQLLRCSPDRDE